MSEKIKNHSIGKVYAVCETTILDWLARYLNLEQAYTELTTLQENSLL